MIDKYQREVKNMVEKLEGANNHINFFVEVEIHLYLSVK